MNRYDRELAEGILFTDFYQLSMAQLYFAREIHEIPAQFDFFFRSYPDYHGHKAGFCINAGMESLLNWMGKSRFDDLSLNYLRSHKKNDGKPFFSEDFLNWLKDNGNFDSISMQAITEGRVVHPNVPLVTVQGPLIMTQILESALLNHLNFQILIATKASRLKEAGRGQLVLEFGMRRGPHTGTNAATRAAMIGGADFSSNTGMSYLLGYPPKGTHAHSMVQAFMALGYGELGAFEAYAEIYPDDCLLLVDTINTLESGIPNAIKVFEKLRKQGHEPVGIRLDSGDLAYLSIKAAKMLNCAGFDKTRIVLSNQLDEMVIWQILTQIEEEAPKYGVDPDRLIKRMIYGVGTSLVTSKGNSSLDGVYKMTAVYNNGIWIPAFKISDSPEKTINPGYKKVWRIYDDRFIAVADLLSLYDENPTDWDEVLLRHPAEIDRKRILKKQSVSVIELLQKDILKEGKLLYNMPDLSDIRQICESDLKMIDPGVKRIVNPHIYHVSLTEKLWNLKHSMLNKSTTNNGYIV